MAKLTLRASKPRTTRLIWHGRVRTNMHVTISPENKHILHISRSRDPTIVRDIPQPAPTVQTVKAAALARKDATRKAKAARMAERQRLREEDEREEAELAKQRRSTPGLEQESTPMEPEVLAVEMIELIMSRMYPERVWGEIFAASGVVRSTEFVNGDGFTQYGRLLTEGERETEIVIRTEK